MRHPRQARTQKVQRSCPSRRRAGAWGRGPPAPYKCAEHFAPARGARGPRVVADVPPRRTRPSKVGLEGRRSHGEGSHGTWELPLAQTEPYPAGLVDAPVLESKRSGLADSSGRVASSGTFLLSVNPPTGTDPTSPMCAGALATQKLDAAGPCPDQSAGPRGIGTTRSVPYGGRSQARVGTQRGGGSVEHYLTMRGKLRPPEV